MIIKTPALSDIPELKALWKEVFGDTDKFIGEFFRTSFSPERALCVYSDGEITGMLYFFDGELNEKRIAYLYAIATKKEYRGRGICSALIKATHEKLFALGYLGAVLVPADSGLFNFYEKLGYVTSAYIDEFTACSSDKTIEIFEISASEYARRRRALLPPNSVIQEGVNLKFLESLMRFYRADNFIAAIRVTEKDFCAAEFLGDQKDIPHLINTLGYRSGKVRTCGKKLPFAMYYSFSEKGAEAPSYLGFAFD